MAAVAKDCSFEVRSPIELICVRKAACLAVAEFTERLSIFTRLSMIDALSSPEASPLAWNVGESDDEIDDDMRLPPDQETPLWTGLLQRPRPSQKHR